MDENNQRGSYKGREEMSVSNTGWRCHHCQVQTVTRIVVIARGKCLHSGMSSASGAEQLATRRRPQKQGVKEKEWLQD